MSRSDNSAADERFLLAKEKGKGTLLKLEFFLNGVEAKFGNPAGI